MAQLESIKNTLLIRDRVYQTIRKEILRGGFMPGEPLNILNISKQMGVSCAPVREAFNMLSKDGLVELMPYKKAVVADGTAEDYETAFDLRVMLEPYALRHSIDKIPREEIQESRAVMQSVLEDPEDLGRYLDSDMSFHQMLYCHVESKFLISTLDAVRTYTMRRYARRFNSIINARRALDPNSSVDQAVAVSSETTEHLGILNAVELRNADLAAELLQKHISESTSFIH